MLKILLIIQTIGLLIYTFLAFQTEGADLFSIFLNHIKSLTWAGQFNLDFLCYLTLSGLWIMWINKFKPISIALGITAMILGFLFFAPYILWLLKKEKGDIRNVLIGS